MIPFLNIHTHHPPFPGESTPVSLGLHPWDVTAAWEEQLNMLFAPEQAAQAALIGECGMDRLCQTPWEWQEAAFQRQIALSERLHKPIIIHCVKAIDDIIRLHRGATQPWIIHGFRGKPQQTAQLLRQGFYLSFGFSSLSQGCKTSPFNAQSAASLASCPPDRLFLETDDIVAPIAPLYEAAATLLHTTTEQLRNQLWDNARHIGLHME